MARPAEYSSWSTHFPEGSTQVSQQYSQCPWYGPGVPTELWPRKITKAEATHSKYVIVNNTTIIDLGKWVSNTSLNPQYSRYSSGDYGHPNAPSGIYRAYFAKEDLLQINIPDIANRGLGLRVWPNTERLINAYLTLEFSWIEGTENGIDLIKGLTPIDTDPADKTLAFQMTFAQKTELNKAYYEQSYHVARIVGTNIQTEGEGTTIRFTGITEKLPPSIELSIDIYKYYPSPAYCFAPMQKNKVIPVTLNPTYPVIQSLEPDNIDVNVEQPVKINWASANQDNFKLIIKDTIITGQKETQVLVPASNFNKGLNTIKLELSNASPIKDTKTATFRGYGKPTTPIFDNKDIYNTATPKIKWQTDEQHIYQFQIFKGNEKIYDTGEVISSSQEHHVTDILQNETTYTVKVKVKNDKGLWSELAQKDIEISYVALEPATLNLFETNSQIVVNVNNPENEAFAKCEVYRKTAYTPWRRIAKNAPIQTSFADNLIASNTEYSYKVISYDKQGGATESDIKTAKITLKTEQFINLDGMEFLPRVYTTKDTGFTVQKVQDKTVMKFEGMTAPMIESGEKDYSVLKCSAAFLNFEDYKQFKYIADNAQVIMFRSALGHLIYGQVTAWGDESAISTGLVTINFTFTEVNFIESEIYDGGMTLRIIRLDAGYKLDAGYELDGYYNE